LIETEKQRRWWFATHPEFSSSRTGHRGEVPDRMGRLPPANPAKEAFIREMAKAGWSRAKAEERWKAYGFNENIAQGVATALAVHGVGGAARAILSGTYRWAVGLGQVGAIGKSGGPGKWVEKARGLQGLKHQSKMSGQPIIERDGKYYIKEYKLNDVYYDDYRNGILYEYKGNLKHLFDKSDKMMTWVDKPDQFRDEALRQVKGAKGMRVIWRVGSDQVKAFQKDLGNISGVTVKP
jgi:hypothetical protein